MPPQGQRIFNSNAMNLTSTFQARYIFAFMSMLGVSVAYMMRLCLGLVITKLVPNSSNELLRTGKTYPWDEKTQGIILSAFYVAYLIFHIPGALLSEKFGGKYTFGFGILLTSIFTLITPLVIDDNPTGLIILRFLEGIGEGTIFPALYTLLARWAPPSEKTFITTVVSLGTIIGKLLTNLITGVILQYGPNDSWKLVFYFFGTISMFWCYFWWVLCYSDPKSHPYISEEEKQYFIKEMGSIERNKNLQFTPWKHILTSRSVWALIVMAIGHDWGSYIIITNFSKYLHDVHKFSPVENGVLFMCSEILTIIISWIASFICDYILRKRLISASFLRKIYATLTAIGLTVGLLTASYLENTFLISACVILGVSTFAFDSCSIKVIPLDLSPNYCGSIYALTNGMGSIAGFLSPNLIGLLTPHRSADEWKTVFWVMGGILMVTNFFFLLFGSCELQPWNDLNAFKFARKMNFKNNMFI